MLSLRSGDVSSKDDIKRLADELAQKESKGLHLLVNNGWKPNLHAFVFLLKSHSWDCSRQSYTLFRCGKARLQLRGEHFEALDAERTRRMARDF